MNEVDIIYLRQVALIKYLILIIGLVIAIAQIGNKKPIKMLPIAVILILLISYFFASFPIDFNNWWNDHMVYAAEFYYADIIPKDNMSDPLFRWLTYAIRYFTDSCDMYFFIIAIIYSGFYLISSNRFCNRNGVLIIFILFITSTFFVAYGVNTLRAGLAMSTLILAFSYFTNRKIIFLFLALCAINIHQSVSLTLVAFAGAILIKKPKMCFTIWLISIILSFSMGSYFEEIFVNIIEDERAYKYLLVDSDKTHYKTGFRWNFIIYSIIPILTGYYYMYKKKYTDNLYTILYCTYLLANTFWILVIRANFTDRFAYLSWALMPIILIYPLINGQLYKQQNYAISLVIFLNVAFTFILSL